MKATCYHLRDTRGQKVVGGSLGMRRNSDMDLNAAADWLTSTLEIIVTNSGRASFAHNGKPVFAYLSIEPSETTKGRAAIAAHRAARAAADKLAAEQEEAREEELKNAIDALGGIEKATEILKRAL